MTIQDLKNKRIGVLGFGVNNRHLVVYLANHGVALTVRDRNQKLQDDFGAEFPHLTDKVKWQIGEKTLERLDEFEIVFRSPSIPFLSPQLQKAASKGVKIYSQTKLFFDLCPGKIIGVTGSKGKGTTSTLCYEILKAGYDKGETYLAGNIGLDPFSFLDKLKEDDVVVLELSSFQCQDLHKSPYIAVMLNIVPDHLDHHQDFEEYVEAKAQLVVNQKPQDYLIVNADYPVSEGIAKRTSAQILRYSKAQPRRQSAWADLAAEDEVIYFQLADQVDSFSIKGRKILGRHNIENILPATLVGALFGVEPKIMQQVIKNFPGLEHRLAWVGKFHEADFYDDSIATTPEASVVAMQAFEGRRIHLVAGGSDKGAHYQALAEEILQRCASVSLLPGEASKRIKAALRKALTKYPQSSCLILDKATDPIMPTILSGIHPHLLEGDVVLLAPGAASFAGFTNYKQRAEAFIKAVRDRYS